MSYLWYSQENNDLNTIKHTSNLEINLCYLQNLDLQGQTKKFDTLIQPYWI